MKYDQIKKLSEEQFRRLTGVKKATLKRMLEILREADAKKKAKGGRKSKLSIEDQLLMALEYIREYRTYFRIATNYGISESVAYKIIRWVEDTLFNTKTQRHQDTKSEDDISHQIIGAAIEVHRTLGGPGLLESIYESALCHELVLRGLYIQRQKPVQVVYKGVAIRESLFIDILVEDKVLVEVKATEKNHPIYETQVLTYLRLTGIKLGLLVNFGAPYVKDGVSRIINGIL